MKNIKQLQNNQIIIEEGKTREFYSYNSYIATITSEGNLIVSDLWNYSKTTAKYFYQFISMYAYLLNFEIGEVNKKTIEKLINDGIIKEVA